MICPDCGAKLPDTAKLCWSCRKQFTNDSPETITTTEPDSIPVSSYRLSSVEDTPEANTIVNSEPVPSTQEDEPEPYRYTPPNNIRRKQAMFKCSLLGLSAELIILIAHFNKIYRFFFSYKINADSDTRHIMLFGIHVLILIALVLLFFYSLPAVKYTRSDAFGKMILSAGSLGYYYYFLRGMSDYPVFMEQHMPGYGLELLMLKILLYSGYFFSFLSGFLLFFAAYSKDEKERMKQNK